METDNLIGNQKKEKKSNFKKMISNLYSSYFLTYKSLPVYNITVFWIALFLGGIFLILGINNLSNKFLMI